MIWMLLQLKPTLMKDILCDYQKGSHVSDKSTNHDVNMVTLTVFLFVSTSLSLFFITIIININIKIIYFLFGVAIFIITIVSVVFP